jgi:DNA-binding transcriptional ArsR family regulator
MDICKASGFVEPIFEEIGTHFRVTLWTEVGGKSEVSKVDQIILDLLRSEKGRQGLSTKEIAEAIEKSSRMIRLRLITLAEKGLVSEVGRGLNDPQRKYFSKS